MPRSCVDRIKRPALAVALGVALVSVAPSAYAQQSDPVFTREPFEPTFDSPKSTPIPARADAITFGDWTLYPTMRIYSLYDSNLYQSAVNPISAAGFRFNPDFYAQWTNGIHKTTIYGSIDRKIYPSVPDSN